MNRRTPLPGTNPAPRSSRSLRSTRLLVIAAAVWLPAAVWPVPAAAQENRAWDNYRVLVDRNIFLRDRRPPRPTRTIRSQPRMPEPSDTDRGIVLTGVARHDGEFIAFFEDTGTRATGRAAVGQAIGKGKVTAITLDGVEYERDGSVSRIEIGDALRGGRFVRETVAAKPGPATRPGEPPAPTTGPATASAEPAPATRPAPPETTDKTSDVADILKRMRQRRERELRK